MALDPALDDRAVGEIATGLLLSPAALVAHEVGVFDALGSAEQTPEQLAIALSMPPRSIRSLLIACASLGFVSSQQGVYRLTRVAEIYLLRSSPMSWCGYLDFLIANHRCFSYPAVRDALMTGTPQLHAGSSTYEITRRRPAAAEAFVRMTHSVSLGPAAAWPDRIDLTNRRSLLDIAGGSGAHSIAAVDRWAQLRACVLELPSVTRVATEIVRARGLQDRVSILAGDMWNDALPEADVHLLSQILSNVPPERARTLLAKSFGALPPGGQLIVHESLLADDLAGPRRVASIDVMMLLLHGAGQKYCGRQLMEMLMEAGFIRGQVIPTTGHWAIITALKPDDGGPGPVAQRRATQM